MSIRQALLALLESGPKYGYQLRSEFEAGTGGTWPLNVGQVYTTLDRLERDGMVAAAGSDESGRELYEITDAGRSEVREWFGSPVARVSRPRDELAIKLAMAVLVAGVDVREVVHAQRVESMKVLQDYTRLKQQRGGAELAWTLVLDNLIFGTEAELRWLDHVESTLVRRRPGTSSRSHQPAPAPAQGRTEAGR